MKNLHRDHGEAQRDTESNSSLVNLCALVTWWQKNGTVHGSIVNKNSFLETLESDNTQ